MKKLLIFFVLTFTLISCSSDDTIPVTSSDLIGYWKIIETQGGGDSQVNYFGDCEAQPNSGKYGFLDENILIYSSLCEDNPLGDFYFEYTYIIIGNELQMQYNDGYYEKYNIEPISSTKVRLNRTYLKSIAHDGPMDGYSIIQKIE